MNEVKVYLLGHSMSLFNEKPEALVATAGKLCYSKSDIKSLAGTQTDESINKFVDMLSSLGHESPIEHMTFTFGIEGISRACTHQLVRHRLASYSQQSQRYVDLSETYKYITPPVIKEDEELNSLYEKANAEIFENYKKLSEKLEKKYIESGMKEKDAKKKAIEDARYILPNACETKIIVTMNARELLHFFRERCCTRAQWEIREVANQMLDLCLEVAPTVFKKAGAPCVFGKCKEGAMSCGVKQSPRKRQLWEN